MLSFIIGYEATKKGIDCSSFSLSKEGENITVKTLVELEECLIRGFVYNVRPSYEFGTGRLFAWDMISLFITEGVEIIEVKEFPHN